MVKFSRPRREAGCHSSASSPFASHARVWEGICHKGNPPSPDKTLIPAAETPRRSQELGEICIAQFTPQFLNCYFWFPQLFLFLPHPLTKCFFVTRNFPPRSFRRRLLPSKATRPHLHACPSLWSSLASQEQPGPLPPAASHLGPQRLHSLTSNHKKEDQHDRVEEPQDEAEDVLMY